MIIKNPMIIIKGKGGETLGGKYNIKQVVDGDKCELVITTATGLPENKLAQYLSKTITEVTADDLAGVSTIEENTFSDQYELLRVEVPNEVVNIRQQAFAFCEALVEVIIGNGVRVIRDSIFDACVFLERVVFGTGVISIAQSPFVDCFMLSTLTFKSTTPPTLSLSSAIPNTVSKIYIPAGTLSAYQTATNWSSHASKFVEMGV